MNSKVFLSLGANLGDPPAQLAEAVSRLEAHPDIHITGKSSLLATTPWGNTDQPDFTNQVITLETTLTPLDLLDVTQSIELAMGRVRKVVWGPRLIDIDIIAYDQVVLETPRLTLPHRYAHERDFVLVPLAELAPEMVDWIKLTSETRR